MIHRRHFLTGTAALLLSTTLPAFSQSDQPVQRRFLMEDTYGNVVTNEDLRNYFSLIYFGYTGCPDVCPTALAVVADAVALLDAEQQKAVKVLFVTVDPDRDTAKVLRDYVGFFDDRIVALRGPKAYTDHMVKAFNARYEFHVPDPAEPEEYSVDHTASVAMLGPDGTLIKRFPHGVSADEMAADMREIIMQAAQE